MDCGALKAIIQQFRECDNDENIPFAIHLA